MTEISITPATPEVIHQGIYRLYRKADGGFRIVYRRDDAEKDDFIELPGAMVSLAEKASKGQLSPMDMMRETMRFMGGK